MKNVVIIGSGFGGLATACILGKAGYNVTLVEQHDQVGGRARVIKEKGFTFDMGPSWYLMPDVFEDFFNLVEEDIDDYLYLTRLDPSYKVYFGDSSETISTPQKNFFDIFEAIESGSSQELRSYLDRATFQYQTATQKFLYKNYDSIFDFFNFEMITKGLKMGVLGKMHDAVSRQFKSDKLHKILQYTMVFLGASPFNAPALFQMMSHVDFVQGVYYPDGGMGSLVEALRKIAVKNNVDIYLNTTVKEIVVENKKAIGIITEDGETIDADIVVSNTHRNVTDSSLLPPGFRRDKKAFDEKILAPSALLMYLGFDQKIKNLEHHTLVFADDWEENFDALFGKNKRLPSDPSFYICSPSKSDNNVAPEGKENVFVLVPLPAGDNVISKEDLQILRKKVFAWMEQNLDIENIESHIEYEKMYAHEDFAQDYGALGGTGLGFAHTLNQTALFRPNNVHKKIKNLYYVGADTVPGIGVPMCFISAQLVYKRLINDTLSTPLTSL